MNRKLLVLVFVLFAVAMIVPAVYADPGSGYPGNSESGIDRYKEISSNPNPDAQCGTGGGSGSFGYFGRGMNLAGGANGYQTGLNNSAVCGNRPD